MTDDEYFTRVFWPSDAPHSPVQGVVVGWINSMSDIFVVSVIVGASVSILLADYY